MGFSDLFFHPYVYFFVIPIAAVVFSMICAAFIVRRTNVSYLRAKLVGFFIYTAFAAVPFALNYRFVLTAPLNELGESDRQMAGFSQIIWVLLYFFFYVVVSVLGFRSIKSGQPADQSPAR